MDLDQEATQDGLKLQLNTDMPKSFLVRNGRRNSMTVSDMTICDPTLDQQAMKPPTENQRLSASIGNEDLSGPLDLQVVAYDDLQASNDIIDNAIEPLNLSCNSGGDLRRDGSTSSEVVEPLDLHVSSEYHHLRSGLSQPKVQGGLSTDVRPQCHSSMGKRGEEGAVEGAQHHRSTTSLHQVDYQQGHTYYHANGDAPRRPNNRHPPIDSLLRQTLESRFSENSFFSQQLLACKLRSPYCNVDSSKRHCCCFCKKTFNDKFDLKRHIRTHTGVRPFKCDRCFRAFTQRCSLEIHQKKIHNMVLNFAFKERRGKVYVCEHCGHSTDDIHTHYVHSIKEHREQSDRYPGAPDQVVCGLVSGGATEGQNFSGAQEGHHFS